MSLVGNTPIYPSDDGELVSLDPIRPPDVRAMNAQSTVQAVSGLCSYPAEESAVFRIFLLIVRIRRYRGSIVPRDAESQEDLNGEDIDHV